MSSKVQSEAAGKGTALEARALEVAAKAQLEKGEVDAAFSMLEAKGAHALAAELAENAQLWRRAGLFWEVAGDYGRAARAFENDSANWVAAELFERAGELSRAADLYEAQGLLLRAADLFDYETHPRPAAELLVRFLAQSELSELQSVGVCLRAGELFMEAADTDQAVRLFQLGGHHRRAQEALRVIGLNVEAERLALEMPAAFQGKKADDDSKCSVKEEAQKAEGRRDWDKAALFWQRAGWLSEAAYCFERADRRQQAAACYELAGELELAIEFYRGVGRLRDSARLLSRLGRLAAADQERRLMAEDPGVITQLAAQGEHMEAARAAIRGARAGNPNLYSEAVRQLKKLPSEHIEGRILSAELKAEQGHTDLALIWLEELLAEGLPEAAKVQVMYRKGRLLEERGEIEPAAKAYSWVVAYTGGYRDARRRLLRAVSPRRWERPQSEIMDLVDQELAYLETGEIPVSLLAGTGPLWDAVPPSDLEEDVFEAELDSHDGVQALLSPEGSESDDLGIEHDALGDEAGDALDENELADTPDLEDPSFDSEPPWELDSEPSEPAHEVVPYRRSPSISGSYSMVRKESFAEQLAKARAGTQPDHLRQGMALESAPEPEAAATQFEPRSEPRSLSGTGRLPPPLPPSAKKPQDTEDLGEAPGDAFSAILPPPLMSDAEAGASGEITAFDPDRGPDPSGSDEAASQLALGSISWAESVRPSRASSSEVFGLAGLAELPETAGARPSKSAPESRPESDPAMDAEEPIDLALPSVRSIEKEVSNDAVVSLPPGDGLVLGRSGPVLPPESSSPPSSSLRWPVPGTRPRHRPGIRPPVWTERSESDDAPGLEPPIESDPVWPEMPPPFGDASKDQEPASELQSSADVPAYDSRAAPTLEQRQSGVSSKPTRRIEDLVGRELRLGRLRVERLIGRGSQALVYAARDTLLDRELALKVLREANNDPDRQNRFLQEARLAARVHHNNCLSVYDYGAEDGLTYLVMEYFRGRTLRDILRNGVMALSFSLTVLRSLASGLGAVHSAGIVHRDIKPSNILVDRQLSVRIADFGIATLLAESLPSGVMVGTMKYMAPEQARGLAVDRRADIFAFGAVAYEMLAGRAAFGSSMEALADRTTQPPPELPKELLVPPELRRMVRRCLARHPKDRYPSVDPILELLRSLQPE